MLNKNSKIFLAGHNGMIGSAIYRALKKKKFKKIITINKSKLDLRNQKQVENFFKKNKPKIVIIAAAKVGGINANNNYKANFIYDNLMIQNNLIHSAYMNNVKNLIFLGSSCIYPKDCKQPLKEDYLLSNYLEKTNDAYAIAKISGIKMCESYNQQYNLNYLSLIPCNAYGENDNFDTENSHFFPALIKKIINATAKNENYITLWGDGTPMRELIFSDDIADAVIYFLNKKTKHDVINIGSNLEMSIRDYAKFIMKTLGVDLKIKFIRKNFKGTLRKKLDVSRAINYGWKSKTSLSRGLKLTISDYLKKKIQKSE